VLTTLAACQLEEHLVFGAAYLRQIGAHRHDSLHDSYRERFRERLRIVHGELDVELPVVHTTEALGDLHRFGVRTATMIEPPDAMEARGFAAMNLVGIDATEIVRLDHERVAFPSSHRVAVPEGLHRSEWWERPAVHVDRAQPVVRFVDDENLRGGLADLQRRGVGGGVE